MTPMNETQIRQALEGLDGWEYTGEAIATTFEFADFREAFTAMTRIAFECEAQGHHPDWANVYNQLEIRLSTHDAGGVTEKDFHLARTIETLIAGS